VNAPLPPPEWIVFPAVRRGARTLAPLALALSLAAAGCGGGSETADLANGKKLFVGEGTCGSCHTLARAGTKGTQGPDLDEAFGPARRDGLGKETVEGVVLRQIQNTLRGSIMKPDLVKGDDARDVAAYVALVAGQPGEDTGELATAGQPKVSNKPIVAKGGSLEIPADPTGALAFA
jgi:mono/diheme cytochrome c family protein